MAKATPSTIVLKGRGIQKEAPAGGAITPGDLVALDSAGKYVVHPTAAGNAAKLFAKENEVFGKGITTAYAQDDNVIVEACFPGMEVLARLAASENVVIGDFLESAGDGTLRKVDTAAATPDTARESVVGIALQASNTGSVVRIPVEII